MDRILELVLGFLLDYGFYGSFPYVLVFTVLLLCGLGIPIPEDITLFVAGFLSYYGLAEVDKMILVSLAGVLLGDGMIFFLGRKYGRHITELWPFRKFLDKKRLDEVAEKFQTRGNKLLFAARFMPGFRAPIYFSAGTLHVPFRIFLFYDGIAALISVPAIVYTVYAFGDQLNHVLKIIKSVENGIALVIFSVIGFLLFRAWHKKRQKK